MNNETDISLKFKNSVTGEKKLERYVETLSTIKSVLGSIDRGAAQQLETSAKNTKQVDSNMEKMSKNFNLAFNYTALRTFTRGLSKVVQGFASLQQKSTSYLEDFNLFQVAYRGNYTEATKLVNKLSEMYGLDEDWLVRTTAQFKQLSNAMGLANETGEKVAELMTKMSIDISSLYNIDVDRASSIIQSALAGQTKPARSLGADITQATLQKTLDNLDISSQVSQLSYAEKRLLIMVSLTQQLSGVTNDWARTLESPSNQIRIMNEQWQRLQRNVGNIFMGMISKVLPYLNAVLMVLNEIAKIIAALFGYKLDDFDFFDESAIGGIEDFGDALDSAAESAEKLKHGLRGFDKLNVVSTPSESGASSGAGIGGVSPKLLDAFNNAFDDYNKKLTEVQMKATKIRDRIMEWLGFTKKVDKETGEVSFKFDHITGGTVLGALVVGGTIYSGINTIFKILKRIGLIKFGNLTELIGLFKKGEALSGVTSLTKGFEGLAAALGLSTGALALITGAIIGVGAALVYAYNTNEDFRNSVDGAFADVKKLFDDLYKALEPSLTQVYDLIVPVWETIETSVKLAVTSMYDTIVFVFTEISTIVGGTATVIDDLIHGDFDKAFQDFGKMVEDVWENWDEYYGKMEKRFDDFKTNIKTKLEDWWEKLKIKLGEYIDWLDNKFPEWMGRLVGTAFRALGDKIMNYDWKHEGWKIALAIWNGIGEIVSMVTNLPMYIWNKIHEKVGIINWGDIGRFIIDGLFNGMWDFKGRIANWATGFVNGLKDGLKIKSPSRLIMDAKIGDFSMEAITLGMERQLPLLKEEAQSIVDTLNQGMKEASIGTNFSYDIPQFNPNTLNIDMQGKNAANEISQMASINPTIIVQVGDKQLARQVITDLQDMAKDNGKPIIIGG